MRELKELIDFVSTQKVNQIEIISETDSFSGKSKKLYHSIRKGDILTDEDAMDLLYGSSKTSSYRKLKYRLKKKLINTVFFTDIHNYGRSIHERGEVQLIKNWAAVEVLKSRGMQQTSWSISEKILKTAIKLDRLTIAIHLAKELRKRYALNQFNKAKFLKYHKLTLALSKIQNLELEAQGYYSILGSIVAHKNRISKEELSVIETELNKIKQVLPQYTNCKLRFLTYNCLYFLGMIQNDLISLNQVCDEATQFFDSQKIVPKAYRYSFILKKSLASLQNKDFDTADEYIKKAIDFGETSSVTIWQYRLKYLALIQFLKGEYVMAYDSIALVMNDKRFNQLKNLTQESWYIKEAYLHFLIKTGKLDLSKVKVELKREFRLHKFLNQVPAPSKDKTGHNLSINIIQLLFFILNKDQELIYNKLESMKQYCYRHLKGEKHIRSRTFIKMLQKLKNAQLELGEVEQKAAVHLQVLKAHPSDYSEQTIQTEIIPYEQLWEELLYALWHCNDYFKYCFILSISCAICWVTMW